MAQLWTGEHRGVRWRAVQDGKRLVVQAGPSDRTYNRLGSPPEESMARNLAESFIDDQIDGPGRAK